MVAVVLKNRMLVQDLIVFNIGKIDKFKRCALEYALKVNDAVIIEMLKEFETRRVRKISEMVC